MKSKQIVLVVLAAIGLFAGLAMFGVINFGTKMASNALDTAYDEFKPEEVLRKYEWFKDVAAQCDQKLATLQTYESRFQSMKETYGQDSINRKTWSRSDMEQWNTWMSEYLGLKASYNSLSSEYNSAMSKFNYVFANKGELPKGIDTPLPREFRPYLIE